MNKIGIFYGSTSGNTETVANMIAGKIDADIFNVAGCPIKKLTEYQNLILGTSTWGCGDLQDDWQDFITQLANIDLSGKVVALFGLGDAGSFGDTFVDGIGTIYDAIKDKGCIIIGQTETDGYSYDSSTAVVNGKFVGLPLDEMNEGNLTEARLEKWLEQIKNNFK